MVVTGLVLASAVACNSNGAVRRVVAKATGCPASRIEVTHSESDDTGEIHSVRGCGHRGRVVASAPDQTLVYIDDSRVTRVQTK